MLENEKSLSDKNEIDQLLNDVEDELFEESQEESDNQPDYYITPSKDSTKINRKLGRLHKKGIPLNIAIIVLVIMTIASFGIFVGLYLINNYNDTSKLVNEIDEMEKLFYEVKKLTLVKNETIQALKNRTETEEILIAFNESSESGLHENLTKIGSSQEIVDLIKKIINDNRIIINELELRSNLGFPILPKTSLSNNIVVELELDLSVSNLF